VATASRLPVVFGPKQNVRWVTPVPAGVSSPILTDRLIVLTAVENGRLSTLAYDRHSGKLVWRQSLERNREESKHQLNSSASSTPVTDGENVYVFFGEFGAVSYTTSGRERWRKTLGPFTNLHGMASSPMLAGKRLILLCDQDVGSFLLALDRDTGEAVWRTSRPEAVHGHSTPTLFEPAGDVSQLVVPGSYQLTSYRSEDGKELWTVRGLTWQNKTSAVVDEEVVYVTGWAPGADAGQRRYFPPFQDVISKADSNGDGKLSPEEIPAEMRHPGSWRAIDLNADGMMDDREWSYYCSRWSSRNVTLAVKPQGKRGDITETQVLWEYEKGVPVVSSPLLFRGNLYTIKDGGILTVLEARTGRVLNQSRLSNAVDSYYASPVAGDGKIYFLSEKGKVSVVEAGEGFRTLAVNDLGEACYASPAIADDALYIRTERALYAFHDRP
jgi:outer membrane protein assembly factor BamB